jgi:acetyl esterase/lipase
MTAYEDLLDPQVAMALQLMPPVFSPDADLLEIRRMVEQLFAAHSEQLPPPNPAVIREDYSVPASGDAPVVQVRVYQAASRTTRPVPVLLWIHGGGFFLGRGVDDETFCEQVVLDTGAMVVSVDYRLAPEHPFPAALEDCYAVLRWLNAAGDVHHVDRTRIAVGGVSAGGNLAAALALLARDRGGPALCYQFLLIPVLDDRHETPSSHEVTDARVWNRGVSLRAWAAYLAGSAGEVPPYAAPARASDLSHLPPAYVYVEAQDLLRDEDIIYAARLMQAGVVTELHVYPGTFHGSYAFAPQAAVSQRAGREHLTMLKRALCAN